MRTFDEAFAEHRLTAEERRQLVWHLAMFRARKTVELLAPELGVTHSWSDVLRKDDDHDRT